MVTMTVDTRTRLFTAVLPREAGALLDAGYHLTYVRALYPVTPAAAGAMMLTQVEAAITATRGDQALTSMDHTLMFMAHVRQTLDARPLEFRARVGALVEDGHVGVDAVRRAVGAYGTSRFAGGRRDLMRIISILACWIAAGDEAYDAAQLATLTTAARCWFEIIDMTEVG